MFKRSKIYLFGLVVMLAVLASACSKSNNSGTPESSGSEQPATTATESASPEDFKGQTISVATFGTAGSNASFEKWMNAIADKVGVKLDIQYLGDGEQNTQLYKTKVATKSLPDLNFYHAGTPFKSDLRPQENMADLSNEPWIQDVEQSDLESLSIDGKVYAAPSGGGLTMGVFYNKKVFQDLGLKVPATQNDWLTVSHSIKEAGITPLYISGNESWTLQVPGQEAVALDYLADPDRFNKLYSNQASFSDLENFKGIYELIADMKNQGLINEDFLSATYANAQDQLISGKAAMYIMGDWMSIGLSDTYTAEEVNNIGFFPLPSKDGKLALPFSPTGSISVTANSKHKDAAIAFVRYYMSADGQKIWLDNASGVARPANKNVKVDTSSLNELVKEIYQVSQDTAHTPDVKTDIPVDLGDFGPIVQNMLLGKQDVATALSDQYKKNAKAAGIPGF